MSYPGWGLWSEKANDFDLKGMTGCGQLVEPGELTCVSEARWAQHHAQKKRESEIPGGLRRCSYESLGCWGGWRRLRQEERWEAITTGQGLGWGGCGWGCWSGREEASSIGLSVFHEPIYFMLWTFLWVVIFMITPILLVRKRGHKRVKWLNLRSHRCLMAESGSEWRSMHLLPTLCTAKI